MIREQIANLVLDRKDLLSLYDGGFNLLPSGQQKILALIRQEVEKLGVLGDEEIDKLLRLEFGENFKITMSLDALDLEDDMVYYLDVLEYMNQAQLDEDKKNLLEALK